MKIAVGLEKGIPWRKPYANSDQSNRWVQIFVMNLCRSEVEPSQIQLVGRPARLSGLTAGCQTFMICIKQGPHTGAPSPTHFIFISPRLFAPHSSELALWVQRGRVPVAIWALRQASIPKPNQLLPHQSQKAPALQPGVRLTFI